MKLRILLSFLLFLTLIIPSSLAVSTGTYAIIHTDEGRFSQAINVGNQTYILFDTSIYAYNISAQSFQRKFDIGLNYIGVDFTYYNESFYIAGYQIKQHINSGAGGNTPVITCPIPTDKDFDIFNFTIWQTNPQFGIIKTITLSKELYGGNYQTAINAMHVIFGKNLVVAISGYDETNTTHIESYVYEVDLSTGAFIQKLNFTERMDSIAYYNNTYYINLDGTHLNLYDSNFNFIKTFQDTVYGMHFIAMQFKDNKAYFVGNGQDSHGNIGAVFEILTADLGANIYYLFDANVTQFNAVDHFGNYTYIVGSNNVLYVFDDATNHFTTQYSNDMSYCYNLNDGQYYAVSKPYPLKVIAFYNETGAVKVIWGGYYEGDNGMIYAYMISTDKPANWSPWNPGAGLVRLASFGTNIWTKYKWYIIGGVVFFLLLLSGGKRR